MKMDSERHRVTFDDAKRHGIKLVDRGSPYSHRHSQTK